MIIELADNLVNEKVAFSKFANQYLTLKINRLYDNGKNQS